MTFTPNADVSRNTARRRSGGRTAAVAGGGIAGVGVLVVLVLSLLTGTDLTGFLGAPGGEEQAPQAQGSSLDHCRTGADANADDACRIAAVSLALDQYWGGQIQGYRAPALTVVDGSAQTACGTASNATGPFYCPPEEGVYVDPSFFEILRSRFGASAGSLAQLYVVAHEYGHHVQNITGIMAEHPIGGTGPDSNGVRMELQADCLAGAWVGEMTEQVDANGVPYLQAPTREQLADALNAAATVGDDHIQSQSGRVNPESWTHGSSEQRQRWFTTGYQYGPERCDAFSVPAGDL